MFATMTFKNKIWSLPITALAVFGLSLAVTMFLSTRTAKTIGDLGAVRYRSVDITQRLEQQFKAIVDGLQSAVAEGDTAKLADVNVQAKTFREGADEWAALPDQAVAATALHASFDAYLEAALNVSKIMLNAKGGGDATSAVAQMQAQHGIVEKQVTSAVAQAHANFKESLDAASAGIRKIVWTTIAGAVLVIVGLILVSRFIVGSLWRQLGGDPEVAREFAHKIAAGDLTAKIELAPHDTQSLMATLKAMAGRINFVIAAQTEMSREHEKGNIDYRIDASKLPGTYGELARMSNELVDAHIKATFLLVNILQHYGHGDFSVDMPQLPGRKGDLTRAAAEAKANLLAINLELKRLVDAATGGDFAARGDAGSFQNMFGEMIDGMNQVMAACETGITDVGNLLEALARGDLRTGMQGDYRGEFAKLQSDANGTVAKLTEIIRQIKDSTGSIDTAAREISDGNNDLSQRTEHQAASLEETAASMEEITAAVKQNAENANRANELAIGASEVAIKGGQVVAQVVDTMSSIENSSKKIVDIISVIDGIAFQTNILALNAAVEAARAGEQGRGFAVVASEVRNLAQRTVTAAKEIKELIGESVEKVGAGAALVDTAGQTMKEIVDAVKRVNDIMGDITTASAEQSSGIESVNVAITQMDEATQQNAALVEQAAAAAKSLQEQAESLSQAVSIFEVGDALVAAKQERAPIERRGPDRAKNIVRMPPRKPAARTRAKTAAAAPDSSTSEEWKQF
jgi:methyl-accepting chemotaxis protein